MHADLRDREDAERHRNARPPQPVGAREEKCERRQQRGKDEANEIALCAFPEILASRVFGAGSCVERHELLVICGHRATPTR